MTAPRIGSLFTGSGMLDEGVRSVLGGSVAWHAEIDPAASQVLAHRYPDVPNLGDLTAVDWATVEPVDVLTGGFPCQDVSAAGKRAGLRAGTRSGLWARMCDAIDQLRPALVVAENVRGLLSAEADSALEPCPGCVGDDGDGAVLRALGRVLGDLADLGYDASWYGLRAADVGAPHGRFRVFIVAADTTGSARSVEYRDDVRARWGADGRGQATRPGAAADSANFGHERGGPARDGPARDGWPGSTDSRKPVADASRDGWDEGWTESAGIVGGPDAAECGATTADPDVRGCEVGTQLDGHQAQDPTNGYSRRGHADGHSRTDDGHSRCCHRGHRDESGHPARFCGGRHHCAPTHTEGRQFTDEPTCSNDGIPPLGTVAGTGDRDRSGDHAERDQGLGRGSGLLVNWGAYEPAIRRWEQRLGRIAPAPTETGAKGGQRLSPRFVEWMMGWPAGWVTDVPGVSRNDALKICGNGVVPQQAAEALRRILAASAVAA